MTERQGRERAGGTREQPTDRASLPSSAQTAGSFSFNLSAEWFLMAGGLRFRALAGCKLMTIQGQKQAPPTFKASNRWRPLCL